MWAGRARREHPPPTARDACVRWLFKLHAEDGVYLPEVLHSSIALFDEYCAAAGPPARSDILSRFVACARLAEKFVMTEESRMSASDWARRAGRAVSVDEVHRTEWEVAGALGWCVWVPTLAGVLDEAAAGCDEVVRAAAWVAADACIMSAEWREHPPSRLAGACVLLACAATRTRVPPGVPIPEPPTMRFVEATVRAACGADGRVAWRPLWARHALLVDMAAQAGCSWMKAWGAKECREAESGIYHACGTA